MVLLSLKVFEKELKFKFFVKIFKIFKVKKTMEEGLLGRKVRKELMFGMKFVICSVPKLGLYVRN